MKRTSLLRLAFVLRLAVLSAILSNPLSVFAAQSSQSGRPLESYSPRSPASVGVVFLQIANSANISGDSTYIDNPLTNSNANALVFVTPNYNPGGAGGNYENHPIGVWYDAVASKWAIFNQDIAAMATDEAFNVLIPPAGSNVFVQTATVANISGDSTYIDNGLTNNNPNAILFVTPNRNPGGSGGTNDNHPIGVWYNTGANKWAIFNQDLAAMPANAAFNVFVPPAGSVAFVQMATAANIVSNWTNIDNPITNNNPYPLLFATPNWNPGASAGTYDNHNIGVWYDTGAKKSAILNQDVAAMPTGTAFNVLIAPLNTAAFVHVATAANSASDYTDMDNPLSNGNPNAIVIATPDYNPGGTGGTYDNHPIGVWYNGGTSKWSIFNQDLAAVPVGAAFNVIVFTTDASEFVQKATAANIALNWTTVYYPLTNAKPNAIVFTTPNFNPGGGVGTYDNHPLGVWYTGTNKWAVFNQDHAAMPVKAAFNVFVPPAGSNVFVQTATVSNISGNSTYIDNALTNAKPNAIVFTTPNWNPGGSGGTYDNHNIGVWYNTGAKKWAIFNQDLAAMPPGAAFNVFVTSNSVLLPLILK